MSNKIKYYILDVFAKAKYQGNQLAVFIDLEDKLNEGQMLQMTREINFAESAFIKAQKNDKEFQVRIFTPEYEVPFAGHPSIGSSFIIAKYLMSGQASEVVLNLKGGDIPISIALGDHLENSLFMMTQNQPTFRKEYSANTIVEGLGIPKNLIDETKVIQEITTGLPYLIIPIRDLESMGAIKLSATIYKDFLLSNSMHKSNSVDDLSVSLFFYTDDAKESVNDFNTRMFILEDDKIVEDAATGSANGCFLAYLLKHKSDTIKANVEQGFQMNRPSYLFLEGEKMEEHYNIGVGGYSKEIANGEWILD